MSGICIKLVLGHQNGVLGTHLTPAVELSGGSESLELNAGLTAQEELERVAGYLGSDMGRQTVIGLAE